MMLSSGYSVNISVGDKSEFKFRFQHYFILKCLQYLKYITPSDIFNCKYLAKQALLKVVTESLELRFEEKE